MEVTDYLTQILIVGICGIECCLGLDIPSTKVVSKSNKMCYFYPGSWIQWYKKFNGIFIDSFVYAQ